eukprot:15364661-Ditylum_brightwellii.AAC.1
MHTVTSHTPAERTVQAHTSPVPLVSTSQSLADQGNTRGALKLLPNSATLALYDDNLHNMVLDLYPQIAVPGMNPQVPPEEEETNKISKLPNYP